MNLLNQELKKCRDTLRKLKKQPLDFESLELLQEIHAEVETFPKLSDREFQTFARLGSGLTVHQIAEELAISYKTVEAYRERLKEKFHCETAHQLLFLAFRYISQVQEKAG